ncbi:MAG: penicillin-binding protein 2 [Patescibacteria group bacterium]
MNSNSIKRIRIILGLFCVCAFVIVCKLYIVQIVQGKEYALKADKQYERNAVSTFDRGSVFFTSKNTIKVAAATVKEGYTLSLDPRLIKDPSNVYEALSQYVKLDKDSFIEKASKGDDPYEEIEKRLDREVGQSIASLKIPGVSVQKENWRVYPGDSLASHTLGLLGRDDTDKLAGRYGLERFYESTLYRPNASGAKNFFAELFSGIKGTLEGQGKEGDILTSIEPTTQSSLEKILLETQKKWQSDAIGGIIMDPKTGAIYSLALRPTFNPNDLKDVKDASVFSNALVENSYEMGSIIKPLAMAAGIDSGAITAQSTYKDEGTLMLSGRKISNYDGKARGVIPMQEILSQSLNTGVAYISLKMGKESFAKYFFDFGLGEKTGIDQPNEQKGLVKNLETGRDVEIATASYGQGIAMTPVQTIRALATLANGGKLITPHLVTGIEYADGTTEIPEAFGQSQEVLKKETTDDVTRMLVKVVDTALKKGEAKMEHYSIAAKTGTAQIADPRNGGYYDDRYLHSFFGYFPAYDPKFIVFLYHVYPKGAEYASETLTDPFMELARFLINYYEIPPDR